MTNAANWIGKSDSNDSLRVQKIADALPPEAVTLKNILLDAAVSGPDGQRFRLSAEAEAAELFVKRLAAAAVTGSGLAALASGFLLYGQGANGAPAAGASATLIGWAHNNQFLIMTVQIAALFAATVASATLAAQDYGKIWTEKRRQAEQLRLDIMETVSQAALAAPGMGDTGLLRQFLEFFRRYQLDLQMRFYFKNGAIQVKSDAWLVWVAAGLAGLAAVGGAIGGLGPAALVIAAFLGIAVPTVLSSVQSWRAIARGREKADAYRAAGEALEKLSFELDRVRAAANAGDIGVVKKFVSDVHGIIRTESGAFVGVGSLPTQPPPGMSGSSAPGR